MSSMKFGLGPYLGDNLVKAETIFNAVLDGGESTELHTIISKVTGEFA
jgi:hypothetical protein